MFSWCQKSSLGLSCGQNSSQRLKGTKEITKAELIGINWNTEGFTEAHLGLTRPNNNTK